MPKTGSILIVLALSAACSPAGGRRTESGFPRPVLRISSPDPTTRDALEYAASHRPALASCREEASVEGDACLLCEVAEGVQAEELVDVWRARASSAAASVGWILEPLRGAGDPSSDSAPWQGLRSLADRLQVCFERPTPDWRQRLWHRALWIPVDAGQASIEVQRADSIEIDARVLGGRALSDALKQSPARVMRRLPEWDARYGLWVDRTARWSSDPVFRRWLSASIDRTSMARLLFDGHADIGSSWVAGQFQPLTASDRRAFASDSRPRIGIGVAGRDPAAQSIAARLKAQLAILGVDLEIRLDADPSISGDRPALWLLCHRPVSEDPLLGLLETLEPLGPRSEPARQQLRWATAVGDAAERAARAARLEREWIADGRLIPLVAVESWLALDPSVGRIDPAGFGDIAIPARRP